MLNSEGKVCALPGTFWWARLKMGKDYERLAETVYTNGVFPDL